MMPSQKDGVANPAIEKLRTRRSTQLFCRSAEIVPSGIATRIEMIVATIASSSEIGSRVAISAMTGLPDHIELPRLRVTSPHRKSRYCRIRTVDADVGVA